MCEERKAIQGAIQAVLDNRLDTSLHEFENDQGQEGSCELRSFRSAGVLVLICSHVPGAQGISITNAAPAPWEQAEDEICDASDNKVVWIEHSCTSRPDGQVSHQFEQVIPISDSRGGVKWKPVGIHTTGAATQGDDLDEAIAPFDVHGTQSHQLLFGLEDEGVELDADDDVEDVDAGSSYIKVTARGEVEIVVLPENRATFVDLEDVQPKERVIHAQALAARHAASYGVRVDPGVVAVVA